MIGDINGSSGEQFGHETSQNRAHVVFNKNQRLVIKNLKGESNILPGGEATFGTKVDPFFGFILKIMAQRFGCSERMDVFLYQKI